MDVCVIDDDDTLRETLAMYIEMAGIGKCFTAEGLSDLAKSAKLVPNFKVAIIDINLGPDRPDGFKVHDWLQENDFKGQTIFISGHARSDLKGHPLNNTQAFLEKPFQMTKLIALMKSKAPKLFNKEE